MKCLNKQNKILLFLVTNGNLTPLFFIQEYIQVELRTCRLLFPGYETKKKLASLGTVFLCLQRHLIKLFLIYGFFMTFVSVRDLGFYCLVVMVKCEGEWNSIIIFYYYSPSETSF